MLLESHANQNGWECCVLSVDNEATRLHSLSCV